MPKATRESGWYHEEDEEGEFQSAGWSSFQSGNRQGRSGTTSGASPQGPVPAAENLSDPVSSQSPSSAPLTGGSTHATSSDQYPQQTSSEAQERDEQAEALLKKKGDAQEIVAAADEAEALRPDLAEEADSKRQSVTKATRGHKR